jgi:hypothetical protein
MLPGAAAHVRFKSGPMRFVVDKMALEQIFKNISVSLANSRFTKCSTLIYHHPGLA